MKAIMKTIKPKTCANIMNLIQSILVIKNKREADAIQKLIDENGYTEIYVYCSKDNKTKLSSNSLQYYVVDNKNYKDYLGNWNGKVLFKFRCYKVEEISWQIGVYELEQQPFSDFLDKCCLGFCELKNYLNRKTGYAIHISDLEIFDKPKEISEFNHWTDKKIQWYSVGEKVKVIVSLTNAPQNYCYVEVK